MIPHPKRDRILERFDIALLKLERGVNILKYTPVCLPELGKEFYGEEGISVGEKNQINLSFFWGGAVVREPISYSSVIKWFICQTPFRVLKVATFYLFLDQLLTKIVSKELHCRSKMWRKQAGAELCQAQVKLKVVVEVEFGVDVEACYY